MTLPALLSPEHEPPPPLPPHVQAELQDALARLSRGPGLASRLAELLGTALGGVGRLAGGWGLRALRMAPGMEKQLAGVAEAALQRAFDIAVLGLPRGSSRPIRTAGHRARLLVMASGAAGGAAGLAGFAPDVAVTTLAIMRRIARIAHEEGEDLGADSGRRACLEVFALRAGVPLRADGESQPDTPSDAGYFPTRLLLQGAPLVRLLAEVASRYGVQLGQKLAAQAVPVVGAVCGAAINAVFIGQYDKLARAHFTIRRLEREWGVSKIANFADNL